MGYTGRQHRRVEVFGKKHILGAISPKEPGEPYTSCGPEHSQSVLQWGSDRGSRVVGQSLRRVSLLVSLRLYLCGILRCVWRWRAFWLGRVSWCEGGLETWG